MIESECTVNLPKEGLLFRRTFDVDSVGRLGTKFEVIGVCLDIGGLAEQRHGGEGGKRCCCGWRYGR
jgi:hypothetical protein